MVGLFQVFILLICFAYSIIHHTESERMYNARSRRGARDATRECNATRIGYNAMCEAPYKIRYINKRGMTSTLKILIGYDRLCVPHTVTD